MDVYIGIDVVCVKDKYLLLVMCYRENEWLILLFLVNFFIKLLIGLGNVLILYDEVNEVFVEDVV